MHPRSARGAAVAVAWVTALAGCRSSGSLDPRLYGQARPRAETGADSVRVTFLGTAGFLVERGNDAVMTAPLFSNPTLESVLSDGELEVDEALIDARLPAAWLARLDAILVGHSHYDHLMDVPYVARTKAPPQVAVFGSRTAAHLIASELPARRRSVTPDVDYRMCPGLETCEGDNHGQEGRWIPVTGDPGAGPALRIRALCSRHSPQFARLRPTWPGCRHADVPPPRKASEWVMGDTLAYLIDFLQDGRPVFRVYYQDSATRPTLGYVHPDLIAERPVDLAILCAGAFKEVDDNPRGILINTRARHVLLGHWDDFFIPQDRPLRSLPAHDFAELVRRLEDATGAKPWEGRYHFPAPGTSFAFPVQP